MASTLKIAQAAKEASRQWLHADAKTRNQALQRIAAQLGHRAQDLLAANASDLRRVKALKISRPMLERMTLDRRRIESMCKTAEEIAAQEEVVGIITEEKKLHNGLWVQKQRIPLGVIAMIFESRPNVVIDCSCLAIKSGNAIILKGGNECTRTNKLLAEIVRESIREILPINMVQIVDSKKAVNELITMVDYVDVVIPRGGEGLIRAIYKNSKVPVIAHFRGLCHIYIHQDADLELARKVSLNAKIQRPGVCNAMECLLLHKSLPQNFIQSLLTDFITAGVELRGCKASKKLVPQIFLATKADYNTEYLDKILSVKIVDSLEQAIQHIQKYGTHHTEGICTTDPKAISQFQSDIDASCIMTNTSTRMNDGGELGLGAELGISTSKLHAYGPMGAREMTTTRFLVSSDGKIRS